jgi:large subunit ribosomal protein L4
MAVQAYTKAGTKSATAPKLDAAIFGVSPESHALLKAAYTMYLANGRDNLAVTKTRGLVRGGGKKPWKQKGTGRARFGSSRVPIWRGGGITFGPTGQENYSKQMNAKARRLALRQALSLSADEKRVKVIEAFDCKDGKTAQTAKLLKKIEAQGQTLIIVKAKDDLIERATRNLPGVKAVAADYLNVFDVINADNLVFSTEALTIVSERLGEKK